MPNYRENKYYYFPTTQTIKIAFELDEYYVYLGSANPQMKKHNIYRCIGFVQGTTNHLIWFEKDGEKYSVTPWDVGCFRSLKETRKMKLLKLC